MESIVGLVITIQLQCDVVSNTEIALDIFDMTLDAPEIARVAHAGQFLHIFNDSPDMLLPRPISICAIDAESGRLRVVFRAKGAGTRLISRKTRLRALGPLGNGYDTSSMSKKILIVGGGLGVPPLLELSRRVAEPQVFLGFRDEASMILQNDFTEAETATDDGSFGFCGNAVDLARRKARDFDLIVACGPKPLLRAVAGFADEKGVPALVSVEERMACGIGACVGCVIKTKSGYRKVCVDGPVFRADEVVWDD
ncbi:MAG: dihydroorotate dehydrogenase electron transfer subunit [Clostridiales bacterium]|jgi:dihydroorotate dehydrogenase electron transfer subunit|nr:dihydroorotate dehydrogenase electron transfer subunit [Clostridiales bacterium]